MNIDAPFFLNIIQLIFAVLSILGGIIFILLSAFNCACERFAISTFVCLAVAIIFGSASGIVRAMGS